jgi:hypothetical protein
MILGLGLAVATRIRRLADLIRVSAVDLLMWIALLRALSLLTIVLLLKLRLRLRLSTSTVEVEVEVEAEVEVEVEAEAEADYSIVATYADSIAELVEKADNSEYCYTVAGCYYYDHECMVD